MSRYKSFAKRWRRIGPRLFELIPEYSPENIVVSIYLVDGQSYERSGTGERWGIRIRNTKSGKVFIVRDEKRRYLYMHKQRAKQRALQIIEDPYYQHIMGIKKRIVYRDSQKMLQSLAEELEQQSGLGTWQVSTDPLIEGSFRLTWINDPPSVGAASWLRRARRMVAEYFEVVPHSVAPGPYVGPYLLLKRR